MSHTDHNYRTRLNYTILYYNGLTGLALYKGHAERHCGISLHTQFDLSPYTCTTIM